VEWGNLMRVAVRGESARHHPPEGSG